MRFWGEKVRRSRASGAARAAYRGWTPEKTVIVAGTQRSGTSWAAELLCRGDRCRLVFEPESDRRLARNLGLRPRTYRRPDADPEYLPKFDDLIGGRVFGRWIDGFEPKPSWSPRPNLLIKTVQMSLMLGWIDHHFPHSRPILLIRHPFAVASSRRALRWEHDLSVLTRQRQLVEDHLRPFLPVLAATRTPFEQHVAIWCVEQLVPLRQFDESSLLRVQYENLVLHPHEQLDRINDYLDEPPVTLGRTDLDQGSYTDWLPPSGDRLFGWQDRITDAERAAGNQIVEAFGLDHLYTPEGLPSAPGTCSTEP